MIRKISNGKYLLESGIWVSKEEMMAYAKKTDGEDNKKIEDKKKRGRRKKNT